MAKSKIYKQIVGLLRQEANLYANSIYGKDGSKENRRLRDMAKHEYMSGLAKHLENIGNGSRTDSANSNNSVGNSGND